MSDAVRRQAATYERYTRRQTMRYINGADHGRLSPIECAMTLLIYSALSSIAL